MTMMLEKHRDYIFNYFLVFMTLLAEEFKSFLCHFCEENFRLANKEF